MTPDWSLDVSITPEDALQRVAAAINQRRKRAFGVLKTHNEFVGAVAGEHFEILLVKNQALYQAEPHPADNST